MRKAMIGLLLVCLIGAAIAAGFVIGRQATGRPGTPVDMIVTPF